MLNNEYELTVIFRPDLEDSDVVAAVEKVEAMITENGGTLLLKDDWGKRKLAYAIKKHLRGHYVLLTFASQADVIKELERRLRIEDTVLRFLTVLISTHIDLTERVEEARVEQAERDAAAKARAEAEAAAAAAAAEAEEKAREYAAMQAERDAAAAATEAASEAAPEAAPEAEPEPAQA